MNYTADIRGDLIFEGFEPMSGAPHSHDEHDLALSSDGAREITHAATPALNLEQIVPSEDGWMDPATEAAYSPVLELNTDSTSKEICVAGPPDLFLAAGPGPRASMPIVTVRHARLRLGSIKDQVSADIGREVEASEPDLMARGVAFVLLQMAKRVGPQYEAAEYEDLSGRKTSPWIASLPMIEGAIKPLS